MLIVVILSLFIVALSTLLVFSVRRNLEFDDRFSELGDQVEESLDIINDCFQRISKVAETPVGSDDPQVQQLVSDIRYTKHALLVIANKIVTFDKNEDEQE